MGAGAGFAGFGVFIGSADGMSSGFDSNSKSAVLIVRSIFESRVAINGGATLSICNSSLGNGGGEGGESLPEFLREEEEEEPFQEQFPLF